MKYAGYFWDEKRIGHCRHRKLDVASVGLDQKNMIETNLCHCHSFHDENLIKLIEDVNCNEIGFLSLNLKIKLIKLKF